MSYPYGMKGAPAVGGGLGGLPRRRDSAAAADQSGISGVGLTLLGTPKSLGTDISSVGCLLNVSGTKTGILRYEVTGPTKYEIGFAWSESDLTLTSASVESTESYWLPGVSLNGLLYWMADATVPTLKSTAVNGASLSKSTVATLPASGTLTIGGDSYTLLSGFERILQSGNPSAATNKHYPLCVNDSGNIVIVAKATIASVVWLVMFEITTAGSVVRSKKILNAGSYNYQPGIFFVTGKDKYIVPTVRDVSGGSRHSVLTVSGDFASITNPGDRILSSYSPTSIYASVTEDFDGLYFHGYTSGRSWVSAWAIDATGTPVYTSSEYLIEWASDAFSESPFIPFDVGQLYVDLSNPGRLLGVASGSGGELKQCIYSYRSGSYSGTLNVRTSGCRVVRVQQPSLNDDFVVIKHIQGPVMLGFDVSSSSGLYRPITISPLGDGYHAAVLADANGGTTTYYMQLARETYA